MTVTKKRDTLGTKSEEGKPLGTWLCLEVPVEQFVLPKAAVAPFIFCTSSQGVYFLLLPTGKSHVVPEI